MFRQGGGPHAVSMGTVKSISVQCQVVHAVSIDTHGNQALRMAMQTREQHIRRAKATSTSVQLKHF
ncbi:hypothetical protein OK016_22355 [Vibrio chagasii]|nr:hypothetical protein [Vibrio chagasii]